ncbi:hypothetical protein PO878_04695 [Iamia majanohamensis]|uniref:Uncharacterized protein n=1 Tax=Iamia majanohamensis TaxID=467976 RepID=A0AAE9YHS1_9ACTN|nr:hypothetical protein [Iamia majanohamensis]WCO68021.1 hypothetical protein PO878_04695 [Iamia majanohamensis]
MEHGNQEWCATSVAEVPGRAAWSDAVMGFDTYTQAVPIAVPDLFLASAPDRATTARPAPPPP